MIKTIIFDLGRVIIPFDFQKGYDRMALHCTYPAAQIPERLRTCDLVHRFESGKIEPEAFVTQLSSLLELNIQYEQFAEIWSSIFSADTLLPESLIESLHRRYRLLLLSNTNAIHFEMVRKTYPLLRHFDEFVLSYKVGAMKPEPAIYQAALSLADCEPNECFFTDDIAAYVEAAKSHGIDAVQFQNREQIEAELRLRGVTFD
ncbi:MAG TPA: HAD family phosphatase [Bryobacteraceae bacterium]|nr:HAD family phosphatase [Bryobacteraceae bacterium]